MRSRRIGELLIEQGAATPAEVGAAVFRQKELRLPLGETLVHMGVITPAQLQHAVETQLVEELDELRPI